MEKKFRLFLLLALLLTAATGAWGMQIYISYPSWPTGTNVNGDGNLVLEMEASDSFEYLKARIEDKTKFDPTYMHLFFNDAECPNDETLAQKGVTANSVLTLEYTPPYAVKLADGTKDAGKWTVKVGEGQAQALPIGGLKGDEKVTLQYTGRLKVKSVTATTDAKPAEATPALSITSPSVGQVIGSDGKNYTYASLPSGVTAVAKICYVSGSNGLALALADEGKMEWSTAIETCAAHTAPFTGGTWKLATKDEWDNMIYAAGSYSALHDGFSSVGGTNMQSDFYWSSTEYDSDFAWYYDDYNQEDWDNGDKVYGLYVRACLAFTVDPTAPAAPADPLAVPMTIEAITAGSIYVKNLKAGMQFSLDGGATKTPVTAEDIALNAGDKVQFYGNGTSIASYGSNDISECTMIGGSGDGFTCKVYGNIMSLLDEKNFATATTLSDPYTFKFLFYNNTTLTDASGLLLPATQLQKSCYREMFSYCSALAAAPALPATQLEEHCYNSMFNSCYALTAAPVLPAKKLVMYCYYAMFNCCSNLATVTCLATLGINQDYSTSYWLNDAGSAVQGTKTVYTVSKDNWPSDFTVIPNGWTLENIDN